MGYLPSRKEASCDAGCGAGRFRTLGVCSLVDGQSETCLLKSRLLASPSSEKRSCRLRASQLGASILPLQHCACLTINREMDPV